MKKLVIAFSLICGTITAQSTKDTLIYFNASDKPENMGQSQKTENVSIFCSERKDILVDAYITLDRKTLLFRKPDGTWGEAILVEVDKDFQN